jgi:hypothetical protein
MLSPPLLPADQVTWLECRRSNYRIGGVDLPLPCFGGDWLLITVRIVPFIMVG